MVDGQTRKIENRCRGRTGARAFSRGDSSPYITLVLITSSMPDDLPKAYKIVGYEDSQIPEPSEYLYNVMALRGWNDYREQMEEYVGHEMPTWDELPEHLKVVWMGIAHGQHGVLAWLGGGTIEEINAD